MRKLYLHCGVHRTGTTLIQTYLANNRAFFADAGVIYPFLEQNHQSIVNGLKSGKLDARDLAKKLQDVPARTNDSILLSGEDFCSIDNKDWLKPLVGAFEVTIIYYLRRQDIWLNSWYNQNIKWPFNKEVLGLSPQEFIDHVESYFWIDYKSTLDGFASIVGRDALSLGVVEKHQIANIVPDFLNKIGLESVNAPKVERVMSNESVSPFAIEILRHLNLLDLPAGPRHRVVQAVADIAQRLQPNESRMVFSPAERRAILARYEASNEQVARTYFGRSDGRLFYEPAVSDNDAYTRVSLPDSGTLLRRVIAPLLASGMVETSSQSANQKPILDAPPISTVRSAAMIATPKSSHFSAAHVHPVVRASRDATGVKWDAPNRVLSFLWEIRPSKSAVEMGCGVALWLRTAHKLGAGEIRGYDIPEIPLQARELRPDQFVAADLGEEIKFERRYDLAISTEVGEYLPKAAAETFVLNLVNSSDWVLFGAAIPYQGGMHHVNENWMEYWTDLFAAHDYVCYDIVRGKFWNDPCVPYYYRQNTILLVRKGTDEPLKKRGYAPTAKPLSLIHPEQYLKAVSQQPREMDEVIVRLKDYMALAYRTEASSNGGLSGGVRNNR